MTQAHVALRDVRATRGSFELRVDHWTVAPGQVVGVVGPNGSGKTTLLRLLPGLDVADDGGVSVFGRNPVHDAVFVRSQVGWMSDDMPLYPFRLSQLLGMLKPLYATWDDDLVDRLVDRFELDRDKKVDTLSKGQGTRVRLLLAAAFRPKLLVLDEPGTGLDVRGRIALIETLLEQVEGGDTSVIVSTHALGDIERISDRLLVLQGGRVAAEGPTHEVVGAGRTLDEALLAMEET